MTVFRLFPDYTVWELTCRCNMRCLHCGTGAGLPRENELTIDECCALIDDLAEMGCRKCALIGGEPLLFREWKTVAQRLSYRGIQTGLITNGLLVSEKVVDAFVEGGLQVIGISLDGTETVHNRVRAHVNSFARAVKAIRLIKERTSLKVTAITQVSRYNLDDLTGLLKVMVDSGVDTWQPQLTTLTGRMREHSDFALEAKDLLQLAAFIAQVRRSGRIQVDTGENIGYYGAHEGELRDGPYLGCYAGCRVVGVESNGNIKGCLSLSEDYVEGNIRDRSFGEIWEDPEGFAYNRQWHPEKAEGGCRDCDFLKLCRCGCANTAIGATGSRYDNPYCLRRLAREGKIPLPSAGEAERTGLVTDQKVVFRS
ncbi:MAG: radical SAM protein [Planctomycetes bacterium]|nr:radical SAM protein [Planctomycetota bacterium]